MAAGLRVGVASQTPLVRMRRPLADIEAERGSLGDPLPLAALARGVDYSVTPGGVARMVHAAIEGVWRERRVTGTWVTMSSGVGREVLLEGFRLRSVSLPASDRAGYLRFKEMVWAALNRLPVEEPDPAAPGAAALRDAFESFSRRNADALLASEDEGRFDVFYLNDWQHLPQARLLGDRPKVMHHHVPFEPWIPPAWRQWVVDRFRDFDAVVVSAERYREALARAGFERPVFVVRPWIEPADYPAPPPSAMRSLAERFGIAEDDEVVLNVGRMDPVKGQDRLLEAFAHVLKRRPDAKLVLVGNGSFSSSKRGGMGLSKGARWRARLEALAGDLKVADRVVFTGHVPHVDAITAFHRANVFAFPSVAEGFGLAVPEAWLARTPVVVSPGAGVSEIVREGENGFVADPADARAFAEALLRALALPEGGEAMGEKGRETALAVCGARAGASAVHEILEAFAERRRPDVAAEVGLAGARGRPRGLR